MLNVILTVGIPSSGKTTWAKAQVAQNPRIVRVSRDDLRHMMFNYAFSKENEKIVTQHRDAIIANALKSGHDVIVDETFLNSYAVDSVLEVIKSTGVECSVAQKSFYVDLEEAIRRDSSRGFSVGEEAVKSFWNKSGREAHKNFKEKVWYFSSNEKPLEEEVANENLLSGIMCDLDGTLSLFNKVDDNGKVTIEHPGVHSRNPYDASSSDKDAPNEILLDIIHSLVESSRDDSGNFTTKLFFCSGRDEQYRPQTESFLQKYVRVPYELFMRKSGDKRKDSIIKEEIYKNKIKPKYNIRVVFDDRTQVVKKWRELGLKCFQVAPGDF